MERKNQAMCFILSLRIIIIIIIIIFKVNFIIAFLVFNNKSSILVFNLTIHPELVLSLGINLDKTFLTVALNVWTIPFVLRLLNAPFYKKSLIASQIRPVFTLS